jgi:hypothetical protein
MTRMRALIATAALALGGLIISPEPANAALTQTTGFICQTTWNHKNDFPAGGNDGYLTLNLTTEPYCQGTQVGFVAVLSS